MNQSLRLLGLGVIILGVAWVLLIPPKKLGPYPCPAYESYWVDASGQRLEAPPSGSYERAMSKQQDNSYERSLCSTDTAQAGLRLLGIVLVGAALLWTSRQPFIKT